MGDRAGAFSGGSSDNLHIKNANIGLNVPFGNGVDLTVGLFDTIVGYEVEASGSNPNVNRSYGYGLEPLTHTGVLASTSLSDNLSVSFGLANAFDSTADANGSIAGTGNFAYLVGVDITVPDSLGFLGGSNLYIGYASGADAGADSDDDNKLLYLGGSVSSPIEGVSLGIAYDDLESPNGPDQDAVAIYALWDVSDGVSLATRYDTLDDGSDSKSMWSVTLGYSVWENVLTRLEYNYETGDRDDGDSTGFALNLFYQF